MQRLHSDNHTVKIFPLKIFFFLLTKQLQQNTKKNQLCYFQNTCDTEGKTDILYMNKWKERMEARHWVLTEHTGWAIQTNWSGSLGGGASDSRKWKEHRGGEQPLKSSISRAGTHPSLSVQHLIKEAFVKVQGGGRSPPAGQSHLLSHSNVVGGSGLNHCPGGAAIPAVPIILYIKTSNRSSSLRPAWRSLNSSEWNVETQSDWC